MALLAPLDLLALILFVGAWMSYHVALEWVAHRQPGLNARMDGYRDVWMMRMLDREVRIVDTQIMASLQNGTAFFASTSLIAVGGALTLLRSSDDLLAVAAALPFGVETPRVLWELKAMGLAVIFVYAFFKFSWSYRLFNYVAILIGAMPHARDRKKPAAKSYAMRAAHLCTVAGRHFNRGQRAFFFALGYLGWFISPWLFMAATAAVVLVMWRRQFMSDSLHAIAAAEKPRYAR
ncbi:MAG: DUF599 domain-containing protein [Pseudorhodoplanes sp.]|nr:DUF599 domain-containing protein [Pseudorhodoplanes sp.]